MGDRAYSTEIFANPYLVRESVLSHHVRATGARDSSKRSQLCSRRRERRSAPNHARPEDRVRCGAGCRLAQSICFSKPHHARTSLLTTRCPSASRRMRLCRRRRSFSAAENANDQAWKESARQCLCPPARLRYVERRAGRDCNTWCWWRPLSRDSNSTGRRRHSFPRYGCWRLLKRSNPVRCPGLQFPRDKAQYDRLRPESSRKTEQFSPALSLRQRRQTLLDKNVLRSIVDSELLMIFSLLGGKIIGCTDCVFSPRGGRVPAESGG